MKFHEIIPRCNKAFAEKDYKRFLKEDFNFHLCIAESSGNAVIFSMIQIIQNLMKKCFSETDMVDESQFKEIYEEHKMIYGFLMAKDGQRASKAMEEHLGNAMHRDNFL